MSCKFLSTTTPSTDRKPKRQADGQGPRAFALAGIPIDTLKEVKFNFHFQSFSAQLAVCPGGKEI